MAEELIEVDDNVWKEIENTIGFYTTIKLKIGEDTIQIEQKHDKRTINFFIFINGHLKLNEDEENKKKYWFEKKKMKKPETIKHYKKMAKLSDGVEKKKYEEKAKEKVDWSLFLPSYSSLRTLKSDYKRRHEKIYWMKEEEWKTLGRVINGGIR